MEEGRSISAVIITFNEEANIRRCIASLVNVAEEIIVVDSHSTDNTVAICEEFNVKVVLQSFLGFIEQKNYALSCAKHDFVLSLDADESLSKDLQDAIISLKSNFTYSAYQFNRLNNFYGKWLKYGKWYPDRKVRIWDKTKYQWAGTNPHDKVHITDDQKVPLIKGDILHYAYANVSDHVTQIQKFALIHAHSAAEKGKKSNLLVHVILNPIFKFIKRYFFYLGFLDGYYGFVACLNSAMLNYLKYVYLREINKNKQT